MGACSVKPEEIQVFNEYLSHEKSAQVVVTETEESRAWTSIR